MSGVRAALLKDNGGANIIQLRSALVLGFKCIVRTLLKQHIACCRRFMHTFGLLIGHILSHDYAQELVKAGTRCAQLFKGAA